MTLRRAWHYSQRVSLGVYRVYVQWVGDGQRTDGVCVSCVDRDREILVVDRVETGDAH